MTREEYAGRIQALTKSLYYIACSLLAVQADREDALQSCVLKGLMKCETLRDAQKFRPWITRILINECYGILRHKKRVTLPGNLPEASAAEVDPSLRDAVLSLPDRLRIPFTMQLEGYTAREIAQVLRIPEGTAKTRIRDAKASLRRALAVGEEVLAQ